METDIIEIDSESYFRGNFEYRYKSMLYKIICMHSIENVQNDPHLFQHEVIRIHNSY